MFGVPALGNLGNAPRGLLRNPGLGEWDFSLVKDTKLGLLGEEGNVQFRAEFFNLLNRANFGFVNTGMVAFNAQAPISVCPSRSYGLQRPAVYHQQRRADHTNRNHLAPNSTGVAGVVLGKRRLYQIDCLKIRQLNGAAKAAPLFCRTGTLACPLHPGKAGADRQECLSNNNPIVRRIDLLPGNPRLFSANHLKE